MRENTFRYSLSGLLTGVLNGLFGGGGGMILIPMLTRYCKMDDKKAFACSVCIVLPISIMTILSYAIHGTLNTDGALPYLIGGAIGGVISGLTFRKISANTLHKALGILIIWGGARLLIR